MSHDEAQWAVPRGRVLPEEDEVHVWRASLDVSAQEQALFQSVLSQEEAGRAARFYFERDRLRWTVAHGVLRILLGQYLAVDPRSLQFATNDYGKPFLTSPSHGTRLHFNISHSNALALFAFCYDRQVGVDVEYRRTTIEYEALAKYQFSPYEYETLLALPPALREEAFFLCWSRKEAYIKAKGKGLSIPLAQFDVSLTPGEPAMLLDSKEDPQAKERWSLYGLEPGNGYAGALMVEGSAVPFRCWQWQSGAF